MATAAPGAFFWALDVEAFLPRAEFTARLDELVDQIRRGERAPGVDELVVPGERGERRRRALVERCEYELDDSARQMLAAGLEALGVPPLA
jgi:LDH2 family malate/lactate/ureidoglycolate dehydrogenase